LPEDSAYATVGGFVLAQLGFIPRGGESFEYGQFRFTVVEMDGRRVARVKIQRARPAPEEERAVESNESAEKAVKGTKPAAAEQ
jgi:putative hemolysin